MRIARRTLAFAGVTLLSACNPTVPDSRVVTPWIGVPYDLATAAGLPPLHAARASSYLAVAMHEAWVGDRKSGLVSLGGRLNGFWSAPAAPMDGVDGATAAAEAARVVMDSLFFGFGAASDSLAMRQIAQRGRERVRKELADSSLAFGRAVAASVLAWARTDNGTRTMVVRSGDECAAPLPAGVSKRSGTSSAKPLPDDSATSRRWADLLVAAATRRPLLVSDAMRSWVRASIAVYDAGLTARRQMLSEGISAPSARSAVANAAVPVLVAALGDSANGLAAARDDVVRDSGSQGRSTGIAVQRGSSVGQCVSERILGRLSVAK